MKTILHIEGMSCDHCVRHVTEALKELGGVDAVTVNLEAGTAAVEHREGVSPDIMKHAVAEAGYDVKAIS